MRPLLNGLLVSLIGLNFFLWASPKYFQNLFRKPRAPAFLPYNQATVATGIIHERECGKYRGVWINCFPRSKDPKYHWSGEEIIRRCKIFIRESKNKPGCFRRDLIGCYCVELACHQMMGGPLVIDGIGNLADSARCGE